MSKKNSALELTLHSGIAHMTYKLDATAVKTWFYLVARVFNYLETTDKQMFSLPSKELFDYLGTRNYSRIREILESIRQTGITFNVLGKDSNEDWLTISLLSAVGIKDGQVIFEVPSFLKEKLLVYKEMFVVINLMLLRDFRSKHALALYVVLTDYLIKNIEQTEKIFTIEELRQVFDIKEGEYTEYAFFNRDVLKKAVDEVNKKSNLKVRYIPYNKIKRKIVSLKFTFRVVKKLETTKGKVQLTLDDIPPEETEGIKPVPLEEMQELATTKKSSKDSSITPTNEKLIAYLDKYSIVLTHEKTKNALKQIIESFGNDKLDEFLLYIKAQVDKKAQKEELNNVGGVFISYLKSESFLAGFEQEQEKQRKKEDKLLKLRDEKFSQKLNSYYFSASQKAFITYIETEFEKFEPIIQEIVKESTNPFVMDTMQKRSWKNPVVVSTLYEKSARFDYCPIPFEDWKDSFSENLKNKEQVKQLRAEALKEAKKELKL